MSRHPNDKAPEAPKPEVAPDIQALLARMREAFGKKGKREPTVRELNTKWHEKNKPLEGGAQVARANPEDSSHWKPVAKVTYVHIQECACCSNTTEYTGSEYVKFQSVFGMNGGTILRKAIHCSTLFLINDLEKPLEDLIEWHFEMVSRCPGCILVEKQAEAILWEEHLRQQAKELLTQKVIDIVNPLPRSMDEALKPSERETS